MVANISNVVSVGNITQFTASLWVVPPADQSNPSNSFSVDLINVETNDANLYNRLSVRLNTNVVASVPRRAINYDFGNFIFGEPDNKSWSGSSILSAYTPGSWHHFFIGMDTAGINTGHCIVNLVDKTNPNSTNDTGFVSTVNGCKFGMPTTPAESSFQSAALPMAEVQIWFGTFISPTEENMAKFIRIVGNTAKPQNPTLAAAAFGTPTYSFRGQPSAFINNRGNGGAVSQSGSINNYTPVPG